MNEPKLTLVLGASDNPQRYSNLAIQRLRGAGHPVIAVGKRHGWVSDIEIQTETRPFPNIHTITLYLNPLHQKAYYDYILSLQPQRIIFNPGTENPELAQMAEARGIATLEACTLVMLAAAQY